MQTRSQSSKPKPGRGVLLIGAKGMLGSTWLAASAQTQLMNEAGAELALEALDLPEFDLRNKTHLEARITERVALVINCAGFTDVDAAELNPEPAMEINARAVGALAQRCAQVGATLVHYSTDYVFDGERDAPYPVDHPRNPINVYGKSKAKGETLIEQSGAEHLIIRTSWLFAPHGRNFVTTMAKLTRERPQLSVVADQRGRPTSTAWLVEATRKLLSAGARGVAHVGLEGVCSWHELACAVARILGETCEIAPCATDEYPSPAPRPPYSALDLMETNARIGAPPQWESEVERILRIYNLRTDASPA